MPKSRKTPIQIGLEHHLRPGRAERPRGSSLGSGLGLVLVRQCRCAVLTGSSTAELPTASPVSANCVAQMFLLPLGGKGLE